MPQPTPASTSRNRSRWNRWTRTVTASHSDDRRTGQVMATKQRDQVRKGPHGGMQLVLIEDVPHLGKQGELVEVKPGYGRNYLLPRGLATVPTQHNLRLLE